MTDRAHDREWGAWLSDHPYDAELWAEYGDGFRRQMEGTLAYRAHVMALAADEIKRGLGDVLRQAHDEVRNRALIRALRANGDGETADRIEGHESLLDWNTIDQEGRR